MTARFEELSDEFPVFVGIFGYEDSKTFRQIISARPRRICVARRSCLRRCVVRCFLLGSVTTCFCSTRQVKPETSAAFGFCFSANRAAPAFNRNFTEIEAEARFSGLVFSLGEEREHLTVRLVFRKAGALVVDEGENSFVFLLETDGDCGVRRSVPERVLEKIAEDAVET